MSNSVEMSTVQSLRTFVNERLTAAVEEILGVFEKTIVVYEEEIDRQRKLLDIVLKPQIKLHRTEPPQPSVCKEELLLDQQHCKQESNSSLGQEVPEPPQIKEEPEELCSSQEGEQPFVQEEADVCKLTPASERSDHSEHESLHSDPDQTQSAAEEEAVANISFKLIKPEADREDSGESEPNSDRRLHSHNHHVAESEGYKTSSCGNTGSTRRTEPKQQKRRYNCDSCRKEFSDLKKLRTHKKTHHGKQLFRCDTCGKEFIYMSCFEKHMRAHTEEKFKTHLRSHTHKRPYRCDTCGKAFRRSSYLLRHRRTHTGEKPFKCKLCGKGFSCQSNYARHVRVHTGQKTHSCIYCGKLCAVRSALTEHLRVHTGEKPYKCIFCGQRFTLRSNMKRHTKTHTGEKPIKCSTCGKAFAQNANLKIHRRIHTGERPYRCSTCGKGFTTCSQLKRHMTVHTGSASSST